MCHNMNLKCNQNPSIHSLFKRLTIICCGANICASNQTPRCIVSVLVKCNQNSAHPLSSEVRATIHFQWTTTRLRTIFPWTLSLADLTGPRQCDHPPHQSHPRVSADSLCKQAVDHHHHPPLSRFLLFEFHNYLHHGSVVWCPAQNLIHEFYRPIIQIKSHTRRRRSFRFMAKSLGSRIYHKGGNHLHLCCTR